MKIVLMVCGLSSEHYKIEQLIFIKRSLFKMGCVFLILKKGSVIVNNFKICLNNHFVFNGFIVQPGMIFGIGPHGESIITNGKPNQNGFWIYTNIGTLDGEFNRIHVTEDSHSTIYHKIQKALRQRKRRNINGVQYRTPAQLEFERWQADPYQKHFKTVCNPVGKTPKIIASKNEAGTAKYNAMKERSTLTQKPNVCKYNTAGGYTIII